MSAKQTVLLSLVTFRNSQGEAARGTLLKLERSAAVFEVYNPYSIVQLSEVLQELTIRRGDDVIYRGRAVVSNLVNTGLMLIVSATLVDTWVEALTPAGDASWFQEESDRFVSEWSSNSNVRDGFRLAVGKLCSFLEALSHWLEQVRANTLEWSRQNFQTYDSLVRHSGPILDKLAELNLHFEEEAALVGTEESGAHKAFVQRELHPLIMRAPYPYRTFQKPLGYAGDYEMMNMIHREQPDGPSPYAQIINAAYINLPIARCVRNRVTALEGYIAAGAAAKAAGGERFRAISVGCGPAVEVRRFIQRSELSSNCRFDLLDFNQETLDYARSQVEEAMRASGNRPQVNYIRESVHFLLKKTLAQCDADYSGAYDLVYCAGLFDYLSDRVVGRLVRLFYSWLRTGGTLLVTNMHERDSTRHVLEFQAEWYLIYRHERQMEAFARGLGPSRTFTDETGVNLCLEVVKLDGDG